MNHNLNSFNNINSKEQDSSLLLLQQHGLIDEQKVNDSLSKEITSAEHTPWFINVLFGFSGVFASLLFIGFLTLILFETEIFDSVIGLLITGGILSVIGWSLFYNARLRHSPFWNSLAFAITSAGQGYITFALLANEIEKSVSVVILLLIQLFMTIVMPNFVYRLLSSMAALSCLVYLLSYYHLSEVSLGLLAFITIVANLQRYAILQRVDVKWRSGAFEISKALMYASTFILLVFSVYVVASEYGHDFFNSNEAFRYNYIFAQALLVLASLYALYLILKRYDIKLFSKLGVIMVCVTLVLGITSVYVSGLLATSLIIIIAMANSQRILLGVGIFALVSYVFWYYYQLDTSLLLKSASMLTIGIGLLLMRWLLIRRYFGISKKNGKALVDNDKERLS